MSLPGIPGARTAPGVTPGGTEKTLFQPRKGF